MSCSDVQTIKAGDGSKTQFSFDFPYIFKSEIHVYFWNATTKEYDEKLTTDSTYPWRITDANPTIVEFTSTAPPAPTTPSDPGEPTVDNVKIRRITKVDDIRALFNPGSAIRSDDLNKNFEQLRYAIQEANCQGIPDDVDQYLKDYYWDRYDNTLYDGDTWVSNDTKIASSEAIDDRIDSKIDTAIEGDILVDGTGLNKTASGGRVTIGISANSVDLDRIKNTDKISLTEQEGDPDRVGTDDQIFTAQATTRRFNNYYQNEAPTTTAGIGEGQVWVDPNDDLTLSVWSGSAWVGITSGGTFTNQPKVVYVDASSGDDANDGHRISRPKATIKAAVTQINSDSTHGDGSIVVVAPGVYQEACPIQIQKRDVAIVGTSVRNCVVHPTPATETATMFEVNSGSYLKNLTFTGMKASGTRGASGSLWENATYGLPPTQGWNVAFYNNAMIYKSPYVQNCTNFSDSEIDNSNLNFYAGDANKGRAGDLDSAPTGGGLLVDGSTPHADSPLRSIVCDSYTHTGLDAPGIFVTNNGYMQATSSYAFFNHAHITCINGGQANLAASTTDFGRFGLIASGKSTSAIFTSTIDGAVTNGAISFNIDAPTAASGWHGSATRPQSNMLVTVNSVTYPILSATANGSGWTVTISRPNPSNRSINLGVNGNISDGAAVSFFLRSMIASSGHTMEYVGSGTDYRALPGNGGVPNDANQKIELDNGKIWTATTDQNGKFIVGGNQTDDPFFEVDQQLGFVTIPEGSIAFNLLSDLTPQLGGNLDVNGNSIVSTNNGDIDINPDGTGNIDVNSHQIKNVADPTSTQDAATKNYVDTQIGGIDEVVEDLTPQLGGNLDLNSKNINGTGNIDITGSVTASADSEVNGVSIGRGAGNKTTNTVVGNDALDSNTTGVNNTAFGYRALDANTTGTQNTAVGANALDASTSADSNTAVGFNALTVATAGSNTAVGTKCLDATTTGDLNTAVGVHALGSNTTGTQNVSVGAQALLNNSTANYNTAVGSSALKDNTTGNQNVAVGRGALMENTEGGGNTAVGDMALDKNTTAANNVAIGISALGANTEGTRNTAVGGYAMQSNTTANDNTAIGYTALLANTTGTKNAAVGAYALDANSTGNNNTAVGYNVLGANTTGSSNVAMGDGALTTNTTASNNTAIGTSALLVNTTGTQNVAVGTNALDANTTANDNTAVGYNALTNNQTGHSNVAVGRSALQNNTANNNVAVGYYALGTNTTGTENVAIGTGALDANSTGIENTAVGYYSLSACSTGRFNTAIGRDAMLDCTTGQHNTALGADALYKNTTASQNVAVGYQALENNTTGEFNTAVGFRALEANQTSDANVAVGKQALQSNTTGNQNVAVGTFAADSITTGTRNVAIGHAALEANQTVTGLTAVGAYCLDANATGDENTGVGYLALSSNTSGTYNTAVGKSALYNNTTANNNTGIGRDALYSNTTGAKNTAVGADALQYNSTGSDNVAVGHDALDSNTTGDDNTAIGQNALSSNTGSNNNTAVGSSALAASTGAKNTAVGAYALDSNTTAEHNVAVGYAAMDANTTGYQNVAIGAFALDANTTGENLVAIGYNAMTSNTTNSGNTAVGAFAMEDNSTGSNNTGIGYHALKETTTGAQNTAVGASALANATSPSDNTAVGYAALNVCTTGHSNTAIGHRVLVACTTGDTNTAVGRIALDAVTTGNQNVAIGYNAGGQITTGVENVCMGQDAGDGITTGGDNVILGDDADVDSSGRSRAVAIGQGVSTYAGNNTARILGDSGVYNTGNTSSWSTTSDRRLKKNIVDCTIGLDTIKQIVVRNFEYRAASEITDAALQNNLDIYTIPKTGVQVGVIAQELEAVIPTAVATDDNGVKQVQQDEVFWHMLTAIKDLAAENTALEARIAALESA